MRFKLGYVAGFASGYYLGAKAGRPRYEQLHRSLQNVTRSDALERLTDTVKDKVSSVLPSRGHSNGAVPDGSPNGTNTIPAAAPLLGEPAIAPPPDRGVPPTQATQAGGYSSSR